MADRGYRRIVDNRGGHLREAGACEKLAKPGLLGPEPRFENLQAKDPARRRRLIARLLPLLGVSLDQAVHELPTLHDREDGDVFIETMNVAGVIAAEECGKAVGRNADRDQSA